MWKEFPFIMRRYGKSQNSATFFSLCSRLFSSITRQPASVSFHRDDFHKLYDDVESFLLLGALCDVRKLGNFLMCEDEIFMWKKSHFRTIRNVWNFFRFSFAQDSLEAFHSGLTRIPSVLWAVWASKELANKKKISLQIYRESHFHLLSNSRKFITH